MVLIHRSVAEPEQPRPSQILHHQLRGLVAILRDRGQLDALPDRDRLLQGKLSVHGAGSGDKHADWLFTLPQSGAYNIYAWWPTLDNNTGGARYTIKHAGGETTRVMNQRVDGGQWNLLGQYSFGTGQYRVRLTDQAQSGNVVADAIRITGADNTYSRNIDNVAYPKPHYRSKNILFRKELDIPKEELRYARLFFDTCNSGNYYLGTFDRGVVFYTLNLADGGPSTPT
jgi:hypothetical protein